MTPGVSSVVVADANVLLSAIAGRAASRVLYSGLEIHTTEYTWEEVKEYVPIFQVRYKKTIEEMEMALQAAPIRIHKRKSYVDKLLNAKRIIADKDPDDVDLLALALKLETPIWSNDNHFKDLPLKRYTTAELLKALGM